MVELLIRKRQLALKAETTVGRGTYETALDTDATAKTFAEFHLLSPSWSPNSLQFDRNIVTPSLTPVQQFSPGVTSTELSFAIELAGHVDNAAGAFVEPPCFRILRACGFQSALVEEATVGSFGDAGAHFIHGEEITGATSGAKGTIVGDSTAGFAEKLYFTEDSGAFTGTEVINTSTGISGQSATISALSAEQKFALYPISDPTDANNITLSGIYYIDGKRLQLKGGRANVEFVYDHANPVRATLTMQAIVEGYIDGDLLTGGDKPLIKQMLPKANLGTGFGIYDFDGVGGAQYSPIYNSLTVATNNNLVLRENSADSDGWSFASITDRAMTATLNFDETLIGGGGYDVQAKYNAGTLLGLRWVTGVTGTDAGNVFSYRVPAAQISDLSEGERDSVTIWDATMGLKGGDMEIVGVNERVLGEDNEFVVINHS